MAGVRTQANRLVSTPPMMWMDDLEHVGGADSSSNTSSPHARFLLHPLHAVAVRGRVGVVEFMLVTGYDKDVLDDEGRTPLHERQVLMPSSLLEQTRTIDASVVSLHSIELLVKATLE